MSHFSLRPHCNILSTFYVKRSIELTLSSESSGLCRLRPAAQTCWWEWGRWWSWPAGWGRSPCWGRLFPRRLRLKKHRRQCSVKPLARTPFTSRRLAWAGVAVPRMDSTSGTSPRSSSSSCNVSFLSGEMASRCSRSSCAKAKKFAIISCQEKGGITFIMYKYKSVGKMYFCITFFSLCTFIVRRNWAKKWSLSTAWQFGKTSVQATFALSPLFLCEWALTKKLMTNGYRWPEIVNFITEQPPGLFTNFFLEKNRGSVVGKKN